MNVELVTKEDLRGIEKMLLKVQNELIEMRAAVLKDEDVILTTKQIRKKLNLSDSGFYNRRADLARFGLYKSGQWRMKSSDLDKYINYKKNN